MKSLEIPLNRQHYAALFLFFHHMIYDIWVYIILCPLYRNIEYDIPFVSMVIGMKIIHPQAYHPIFIQVGERRFFVGPRGDDAQNAGRAAGASGRGDLQISGAGAGSETIFFSDDSLSCLK